uniref:Beta-hexosaminidase n=1 Tax=Clytia hemisphaerica TaxID=252671 RepID=A0A7M5XP63_9CNID
MLKLIILLVAISCVFGGKPTLSDNRGLRDERLKYNFRVKDYVFGSLFPKPQEETKDATKLMSLDPEKFSFTKTGEDSDVIQAALVRYKMIAFPDAQVGGADSNYPQITGLNVHIIQPYKAMDFKMDESYNLVIAAPMASIEANTVWGALRGLETFSQAVYQNISDKYYVNSNKIHDFPRFHHRGFLIDTSRHYLSVQTIEQFIDALAYSKYNVLHWHIVDETSFPFVSKTFPSLSEMGSFNSTTHVYNPEDVQRVIEYARMRGVRVLPEFDTPGHSDSWYSIENLLTKCYSSGKPNGNTGPIDPTVESNYEFLKNFFKEVAEVFPDAYLHLGGDEVSFSCWESNPNIAKWMADHDMGKNYSLLEQYYEQRLLDIVGALGKNYVIWQEVVDNQVKVKADTVVNIWRGHNDEWKAEAKKITTLGYNVILSSPWYLNYISYAQDWPTYYKADPQSFDGTQEQLDLVLGGTACMWGEWVDATNLLARTWARALAVGERLWSAKTVTDVSDAGLRMWEHRCRYLRRGIPAENVISSNYCRHEWQPNYTPYKKKDEL